MPHKTGIQNIKGEMNNKKILIGVIAALSLCVIGTIVWIFVQKSQMNEMTEQFDLMKEELTDEYSQLALQYEGYELKVNNDSIVELFEAEKLKVERLREELKTVKSTNAKRINELKKELNTVRNVLKSYIAQVDSLNKENTKLQEENEKITRQYRAASSTASRLAKEKDKLTERVTLASQLNATNISVNAVNKRGKTEKKVSKVTQLNISFTIARNITTESGDKTIYVRIMKPDNDILLKNDGDVFKYENKNINYSIRKDIEYTGEEQNITVYWKVEEFLYPGSYRIDIFADGNMIGSRSFNLKN